MTGSKASNPSPLPGHYPDSVSRIIVALSIALIFMAACVSPAIRTPYGTTTGLGCLFQGLIPIAPPWLANPALLLGWFCLFPRWYTPSIILGVIAVGLGSMTREFIGGDELLIGFFLWQGASVALILGAVFLRLRAEPRPRFTVRALMAAVAVSAIVLFGCIRAYRQVIPRGADFYSYQLASVGGPTLVSPDGRRSVQVMFNDAGAAHSGFHWTWVIVDDLLSGRSVVAQGYSLPDVALRHGSFPLRWIDGRTFEVTFVAGRYDSTPVNRVVRIQ
jgi:hypothetical protein